MPCRAGTAAGSSAPIFMVLPIEVFNRYSGRIEHESIYGERWLRWTYGTGPGRLALALAVKRAWFSRLYGWRMGRPASAALIAPFIARYGIDPAEFAQPPGTFRSFNDFFTRALQPSARPICADRDSAVFPADGRHLGFENIAATDRFYAKGQRLDVAELLADCGLARRFEGGTIVISRLCPTDYHRFHFPCAGAAGAPRLVRGTLASVSPIALRDRLGHLVENKRAVTPLESTASGTVALVEIGATCVGTIVHTRAPGPVKAGDEKGFFAFGGSCVVTLFEPGRVRLAADLAAQSAAGRELYARMGDRMAAL